MILSVCDSSSVLEVLNIVRIIIKAISIIVPIILIVRMSMSLTKSITSKDGPDSKLIKSIINNIIACIAIFMIPILVGILVRYSSEDFQYRKCFLSANREGIHTARVSEASTLVSIAVKSMNKSDYESALIAVSKIEDGADKNKLLKQLSNVKKTVELKSKVEDAVVNGTEDDYKQLLAEVNKLGNSSAKTELLQKLKKMKERIDASKTPNVSEAIGQISGDTPPLQKVNNKNITLNYYKASNGQAFSYWLYVPENAVSELPVVIFIHGLGERGNDYKNGTKLGIVSGPIREINRGTKNYNAIIIQPQIPSNDKSQNYGRSIVELTTKLATNLKADKARISISGFSNGCYGVFAIVPQFPNYFSAAVGMGCTPSNANAFKTVPLKTYVGSGDGVGTMPPFVEQVKKINGGRAWHTQVPHHAHNITHDTNYSVFVEYPVVEWMISEKRVN